MLHLLWLPLVSSWVFRIYSSRTPVWGGEIRHWTAHCSIQFVIKSATVPWESIAETYLGFELGWGIPYWRDLKLCYKIFHFWLLLTLLTPTTMLLLSAVYQHLVLHNGLRLWFSCPCVTPLRSLVKKVHSTAWARAYSKLEPDMTISRRSRTRLEINPSSLGWVRTWICGPQWGLPPLCQKSNNCILWCRSWDWGMKTTWSGLRSRCKVKSCCAQARNQRNY